MVFLAFSLVSNTPELNRTDCRHRRPDSAEVRSPNFLRLTGSRILAGVWEEERPWERGGPEVSWGRPRVPNVGEPSRPETSQQNSTRFTGGQFVNEENGNQMTYMDTSFWASAGVMDTLININRGMTKQCMHVYKHVCMHVYKRETINGDEYSNASRRKNKPTRVCVPRSKRQTSNGDACKDKQTKNKTACACIPRSKRQTSSQTSYVDACKLKQTKKQSNKCMCTSF